jgi:lipoprotein
MKVILPNKLLYSIVLSALCLFAFSCKHSNDGKTTPQEENKIDPKVLQLKSLKVQGNDAINGYAILKKQNLKREEIKAEFIYGNLTEPKEIDVTIKEGEQNLIKGEKRKITLQVSEDVSGKYNALEWQITVAFPVDTDLLDTVTIYTSTVNGVQYDISNEIKDKLFACENYIVEVKGPVARLELGSRTKEWTSLKLNGTILTPRAEIGFKSFWEGDLTLDVVNQIEEIKIEIEVGSEKNQFNFSLKRIDGKVDIQKLDLFVQGVKIQYGDRVKLFDSLLPNEPVIAGEEPTNVEIRCAKDYMKKVKIDEHDVEIKTKVVDGKSVWYASYDVSSLAPNGKNVSVEVEPKDECSSYFNTAYLSFKLDYKGPAPIETYFNINGANYSLKAYTNESILKSSKNIYSKTKFLNLNISSYTEFKSIEINGTNYQNIAPKNTGFVFNKTVILDPSKETEDFVIALNPKDETKFLKTFYKFNARKGLEKEKLSPTLYVNGLSDFPQTSFMDHLEDSTKPTLSVNGDTAKIQVAVSEYAGIFLLKEVEINSEKIGLQEVAEKYPNPTVFVAGKDVDISDGTKKDVTIVFVPKNTEQMGVITWNFSLLKTTSLPPFPHSKVRIFSINGEDSFEDSFINYLTDGSAPKYMVDEDGVEIKIGVLDAKDGAEIAKVKFSVDGGVATDVECVQEKINYQNYSVATHKLTLPDVNEHEIKIEVVPKDTVKYSSLEYKFKLQRSTLLPKIPNIKFYLEKWPQKSGYKVPDAIQKEYAELALQIADDVIESVKIGKENEEEAVLVETFKDSNGKTVYSYTKSVSLSKDGTYQRFIIKAIPKDKTKYRETDCIFELAGSRVASSNAEFSGKLTFGGRFEPYVKSEVEFYDSKAHQYISDYGATKVKFEAQTINPRAKIKYAFVDGDEKIIAMPGESVATEKEMAVKDADFGICEASFSLFEDKPTNLLVYVLAEDEDSKDDVKGRYLYTYNPIPLKWDISLDKTKGVDFRLNAYNEIVVDKSIVKGNKIYVSFAIWKTYEIDGKYQWASYQGVPEKFGSEPESWENERWYKTDVDISSLSGTNQLEIAIPILENGVRCFTYRVKIKAKN